MVNFMWASQDSYEETQVEVMITLVNTNWRKTSDTPEPKWQAVRERYWGIVVLMLDAQPGNSNLLRESLLSTRRNVVRPTSPAGKSWLREVRKSEGHLVMRWISPLYRMGITNWRQCRLLTGLSDKENFKTCVSMEMLDCG
jgi:hypothetical protein